MGDSFWEPSFLASMSNWRVFAVAYSVLLMVWFRCTPHPVTVTNEGLKGFPIKHVIVLVVTVTGWGVVPRYGFLVVCFNR